MSAPDLTGPSAGHSRPSCCLGIGGQSWACPPPSPPHGGSWYPSAWAPRGAAPPPLRTGLSPAPAPPGKRTNETPVAKRLRLDAGPQSLSGKSTPQPQSGKSTPSSGLVGEGSRGRAGAWGGLLLTPALPVLCASVTCR